MTMIFFRGGRPDRIVIKEKIGDYKPLPRYAPTQTELNQHDYDEYTIKALWGRIVKLK